MASVEECGQALRTLAANMAATDPAVRARNSLDRSLSCRITDLDVVFAGRLHDGLLDDIRQVETADAATADTAQVKLTMSSDDLLALVAGRLNFAAAWASGRVKLSAGVFDLIKLRSMF